MAASQPASAAKDFVMPDAHPAHTYPAHDEHPMEKVTIAVDPYDVEYKASIFTVNYRNYGLLPVFFVVSNNSDQPVALTDMQAALVTMNRSKLFPLGTDDLVRRLSHPSRSATGAKPIPLPIPGSKKVKGAISQKTMDEIDRSQFAARAVEPHSTARGFLFFDVSDISNPLAGANFYLTQVRDGKGNDLMYFEISLEKYLSAPQNASEEKKP
ncbi:MAG TPA: hypothetical protein VMI10_23895 [Terriglobales bacterium]|nr:hypothetical protein [Terriglobales bacterium]